MAVLPCRVWSQNLMAMVKDSACGSAVSGNSAFLPGIHSLPIVPGFNTGQIASC